MTPFAAVVLGVLASAPGRGGPALDPALPPALAPIAARAIEMELDPTRGPDNAVAYLTAELDKPGRDERSKLSLKLRLAAIALRRSFLQKQKAPEPIRYEHALSTFARLDLTDPGLREWIDRALAHHPYARPKIDSKAGRALKVAVLLRGADLKRDDVLRRFQAAFAQAGFNLTSVPAKEADFILKLGVESAGPTGVRVDLGLERTKDGRLAWTRGLFRIETGRPASEAIGRALDWLVRIGGRDLLFRWLGERGFHSLLDADGTGRRSSDPHGGHEH